MSVAMPIRETRTEEAPIREATNGFTLSAANPNTAGLPTEPIFALTVEQYHEMVRNGILGEDENVELLEGFLVPQMPKNPLHSAVLSRIQAQLTQILPVGFWLSIQNPLTTTTSEPEPDLMIVRGEPFDYLSRHPGPTEAALIIEVADSSLRRDRTTKKRIFAAAGVEAYWIVNLPENQIEEYTRPSMAVELPDFQQRHTYRGDELIPLILDGQEIATLRTADLLPQSQP